MRYAKQKNISTKSCRVFPLRGIDRSNDAKAGSLFDCLNLTSDAAPCWQVRPRRGRWRLCDESDGGSSGLFPMGAYVRGACSLAGGLCWATDRHVYIGGKMVENLQLQPSPTKQLLPVGRDLFIAPDGVYLHQTEDGTEITWVENSFSAAAENVLCGPCDTDGTPIPVSAMSDTAPAAAAEGQIWIDTAGSIPVAKRYREAEGWVVFTTDRLYLSAEGIGEGFREGDFVSIQAEPFVQTPSETLLSVSSSYIVFAGTLQHPIGNPASEVTVRRSCPAMDFAVTVNNRIWACRYGDDGNGNFVNEVFCSAPGDPLTWQRYGTGEADCFRACVGSAGPFTGAGVLFDDVLFFKEDAVVTVSGLFVSNFRVEEQAAHGVRAGCERSLVRLGNALVYCGVDGVYRTNGTYTTRFCEGFEPIALENAVGGVLGEKYYLAADWNENERKIAVFDLGSDTWMCEDDRYKTQFFVPQRNALYMLCLPVQMEVAGVKLLWYSILVTDVDAPGKSTDCLFADSENEEDYMYDPLPQCEWFAVTNQLDDDNASLKRIRSVSIRFCQENTASVRVCILTDNGDRCELGSFVGGGQRRRQMTVNVLPCTSFRLLLSGKGKCTVQEIGYVYEKVKGEDEYDQ